MPTEVQQIEFLRAENAKLQKQLEKIRSKCEQVEKRARKAEKKLQRVEKQRDAAQERFKQHQVNFCYAHYDSLKLLNASLDMLAEYCSDVPRAQARRLQWLIDKVYNDMEDVLQTGRGAFLSYLLSVGLEALDRLFASVANKTPQQVFKETQDSIAKRVVSIAVQEHKANTVINPLTEGAVAAAQKHSDDALLRAAARVAQTQAAPVKNDKPVGMAANSKKTAGRQVLKAKQWLEHQYWQEYTVEGLCPHCGQKHPRKLIGDISDYLRVVQHNLRELLHEGQFSYPVVACSHCGAMYADRPAAMPVPYSHAAGC